MWARRSLSIHRLSYSKFSKSVSTCLLQSMQQRHSVFWFGWKPFRETLKSKRVFWLTGLLQVVKLWELSFSLFYVLLCLQRERKSSGRNHFLNLSILKNRELRIIFNIYVLLFVLMNNWYLYLHQSYFESTGSLKRTKI